MNNSVFYSSGTNPVPNYSSGELNDLFSLDGSSQEPRFQVYNLRFLQVSLRYYDNFQPMQVLVSKPLVVRTA